MIIRWLGNSCVEIRDGKIGIIIDPNYIVAPSSPNFKFVLITHEHPDHIDVEKLNALEYECIVAPEPTLALYNLKGIAAEAGLEVNNIKVFESWCWKAEKSCSYYYKGVLHNGDSAKFPDVKNVKLAFTACFPTNYEEYLEEFKRIKPELIIPFHYTIRKKKMQKNLLNFSKKTGLNPEY